MPWLFFAKGACQEIVLGRTRCRVKSSLHRVHAMVSSYIVATQLCHVGYYRLLPRGYEKESVPCENEHGTLRTYW